MVLLYHTLKSIDSVMDHVPVGQFYFVESGMYALRALLSHHSGCCPPFPDPWYGVLLQKVHLRQNGCTRKLAPVEYHECFDVLFWKKGIIFISFKLNLKLLTHTKLVDLTG